MPLKKHLLNSELYNFAEDLGFAKVKHLEEAFSHPSYSQDKNYERLEFLGDAVLKLCFTDILFTKFPNEAEGSLTKMRGMYLSDEYLAKLADDINIPKYILMSDDLIKQGGRSNNMIKACVFEAFLGAIFKSGVSIKKITEFINNIFDKYLSEIEKKLFEFNPKAYLQEYTQSLAKDLPKYTCQRLGDDFEVSVFYQDELLAVAKGKSKKHAEQNAACIAYGVLRSRNK